MFDYITTTPISLGVITTLFISTPLQTLEELKEEIPCGLPQPVQTVEYILKAEGEDREREGSKGGSRTETGRGKMEGQDWVPKAWQMRQREWKEGTEIRDRQRLWHGPR